MRGPAPIHQATPCLGGSACLICPADPSVFNYRLLQKVQIPTSLCGEAFACRSPWSLQVSVLDRHSGLPGLDWGIHMRGYNMSCL